MICRIAEYAAELREVLRQFYSHETVHTFQSQPDEDDEREDLLLTSALPEGVADFVAALVTGRVAHPERAPWAARGPGPPRPDLAHIERSPPSGRRPYRGRRLPTAHPPAPAPPWSFGARIAARHQPVRDPDRIELALGEPEAGQSGWRARTEGTYAAHLASA